MSKNLSEAERVKLKAAYQKAAQDPIVQSAKEKLRQASRELREANRAAMLKADPTVQPILSKLPQPRERF